MRPTRLLLLWFVTGACAAEPDDEDDLDEPDPETFEAIDAVDAVDSSDWAIDDARAAPLDTLSATAPLGRNPNLDVIVWSQNIKMGLANWRNIVRCMGDAACNGLGAVPDVILLTEASCENVKAIRARLALPRSSGGLGLEGWNQFCVENPRSGGVTGHWLSNGIIYRSDRFRLEASSHARRVPFYTGDGTFCRKQGRVLPVIRLLDKRRDAAGLAEKRITLAARHDDHFGHAIHNTCPAANADTEFCTWRNSKVIDNEIDALGGGLLVMAGDWNYAAKFCRFDGVPSTNFNYAYGCTTRGVRTSCAPANLGWRDPILEQVPDAYDARKVIDFMHVKDVNGYALNQTARNTHPSVVGAHFYCSGHGPYSDGNVADHPQRMSDHHGHLMRFSY